MKQEILDKNPIDKNGNPEGGVSMSTGVDVIWQNGPLLDGTSRLEPNGAFVETVIEIAKKRLEFYQTTKYKCMENQEAIKKLNEALDCLDRRTNNRVKRGVEGQHII